MGEKNCTDKYRKERQRGHLCPVQEYTGFSVYKLLYLYVMESVRNLGKTFNFIVVGNNPYIVQ